MSKSKEPRSVTSSFERNTWQMPVGLPHCVVEALEVDLPCRVASHLDRSLQYRCFDSVLTRRRPPNCQPRGINGFRINEKVVLVACRR